MYKEVKIIQTNQLDL